MTQWHTDLAAPPALGKDVLRGKESSYLRGIIGDSRSLLKEFSDVQALFQKKSS